MKSSVEIGKIIGIPIRLHITLLLVLPLFAYIFSINIPFGFGNVASSTLRYALSITATIALFLSILLHELAHSVIAMRYGSKVQSITLFLFGGVSSMGELPRNPEFELRMSLAGPITSFALGLILLGTDRILDLFGHDLYYFLEILGLINIVLFVFNMIPAFPMDGGRVLRALLAGRMSYLEATRKAVSIGQTFAVIMGIFGLLANPWLILIAFFVYIGAAEEGRATEMFVPLEGVKVSDLMSKDVISVIPSMRVSELVSLMFEKKHMGYPVKDNGRLVGIVTFSDVQLVPSEKRSEIMVKDIMSPRVVSVSPEDTAEHALRMLFTHKIGRLLVLEGGKLVGIVSRTDLLRAIQILGS
jgi:Zn-dependent protease/CBS domain-containing protein